MNILAILFRDKLRLSYQIFEEIPDTIQIENVNYSPYPLQNEKGMIGFIDWYFDKDDKLVKLVIHILHEFLSETIEGNTIVDTVKFNHEYNLCEILIGNPKEIVDDLSIFQTFSFSSFLIRDDVFDGFILDIDFLLEEQRFIIPTHP
jgi:hypothetical protein